jgi:hypothetical protein
MSDKESKAGRDLSRLVDSCFKIRMEVSPELLAQLRDNADQLLTVERIDTTSIIPVPFTVQTQSPAKRTIKPTLTFEDNDGTMTGVVILQVEVHED